MPQTKTKSRKPKRKPDPLKQFFQHTKDHKPYPKKLRKAVMRELDKEKAKFEKKVSTYHNKVVNSPAGKNPFETVQKFPGFKSRLLTLFDENYEPTQSFQFPNLLGKGSVPATLVKIIWPEKGVIEKPSTEKDKPATLMESNRAMNIAPGKVKKYLDQAKKLHKELVESQKELSEGNNFDGDNFDDFGFQGSFPVHREENRGKFFPYPPNSFTRQMYVPDSWFMLARCAHVYNYNPMAKAGMDIKTSFIIGNGPRVIIKNNQPLSDCWGSFEKKEDFVETLRTWCTMLNTNGELFIEFFKSIIDNLYTVRSIDPGHVYDIITEPRDIRTVYGYKLMYQTANQIFTTGAKGEQVKNSEFIYETVLPDNILHTKINIQENEKRGRSDLLSVLGICQLFEDYVRYKVLRTIVEASFVWDVELKNADDQQIADFLANEASAFPPPASTNAHNENVQWKPYQFSGASTSEDHVFEMLLTIFAVGVGIPREYMGAGRGGTRANAITSTEPSVKMFESRRHVLESLILRILDMVAKANYVQYEPDDVEVTWPAIAPEDIDKIVDMLYTAVDRDTFTKQRVDEMVAKHLGINNYSWTDEMNDRLTEKTQPGVVKSLADGSPSMVGTGLETPEMGKPVVAPPKPAPGTPATAAPGLSGAPSSMSSADKSSIKKAGQKL